jgi:hypothetical protein
MKRAITIFTVLALVAGTAWAGNSRGNTVKEQPQPFAADYLTHNAGNIEVTLTDQGSVGFMASDQVTGRGFRYPRGGANYLFYSSFLAGTDSIYLVDKYYNVIDGSVGPDSPDWRFVTQLDSLVPPRYLSQEFLGSYCDSGHPTPKGLVVSQYSLAAAAAPYNTFVFAILTAKNTGSSPLNGFIGGLVCDFDISTNGGTDIGSADTLRRAVYINGQNSRVGGVKLLEPRVAGNTTLYDNTTYVYPAHDDTIRWMFMSNALRFTEITTPQDMSLLVSTLPINVNPGDSTIMAVAFVGATNVASWQANADTAQALYDRLFLTGVEMGEPLGIPGTFALGRARPNPVSGSSLISFALERGGPASLKVYDLSGRLVSTLVNGNLPAGSHEVRFDGRGLSGGVYFYRLEAGNQSATRKLVLVW